MNNAFAPREHAGQAEASGRERTRPAVLVAAGCIGIAPVVGAVADKGMTLVFAGLALAMLALSPPTVRRLPWGQATVVALVAFVAWTALTAVWAVDPLAAVKRTLQVGAILLAGFISVAFVSELKSRDRALLGRAAALGLAGGAAFIALQLATESAAIRMLYGWTGRELANLPIYKSGCTILALLAFPVAAFCWRTDRRTAAWAIVPVVAMLSWFADGHAAVLAILTGAAVFAVGSHFPRTCLHGLKVLLVVVVFAQPVLLRLAPSWENFSLNVPHLPNSAYHRYAIWKFTAERIAERPLFGWGFDSARHLPGGKTTVAREVEVPWRKTPVGFKTNVLPLHPHNVFLQWWLELGLTGAFLGYAFLHLLLGRLARTAGTSVSRAAGQATLATAIAICMVSYGAWQSWWLASLCLTAVLAGIFLAAPRQG